jgi:hypothetical protein
MTFLSCGFHSPVTGRAIQHDHTFTASLLRHGFYQDNTLTAATKSKERHLLALKRNQQSMVGSLPLSSDPPQDRLATNFTREAKHLIRLQQQLAHRQQAMVLTAQQKFAIPYLQAIFRGFLARQRCVQLRSVRFICDFYRFRLHFRRFLSRVRVVQHAVVVFLIYKKLILYARRYRAAVRLQRWYHHHWLMRRAVLKSRAAEVWGHVRLFGVTRAVRRLVPLERYRSVLYRFMRPFLWKARLRRLLHPLSSRQIFFSLFHSDIFSEHQRALPFQLPSTPLSTVLYPPAPPPSPPPHSGYSFYGAVFQSLRKKELRKSTLETLQYLLRAQHFQSFPFTVYTPPPSTLSQVITRESLRELAFMRRLASFEESASSSSPPPSDPEPSLSPTTLKALRKRHRKSLRVASHSQLETEALFYLDVRSVRPSLPGRLTSFSHRPDSLKHCPYILRDSFRLRSFEDLLTFLHCLAAVSRQTPSYLSSDLVFPLLGEGTVSLKATHDFLTAAASPSTGAAALLKRKRVFKFPTTTLRPFGATIVSPEEGGKKMRYQRRGGALLSITGGAKTKQGSSPKREEVKTKAEQLRAQKALLSMAAVQARQTQRKLDIQSGNIESVEEARPLSEGRKAPPALVQPPAPLQPKPRLSEAPAPRPSPVPPPPVTVLDEGDGSNVTRLNLSLSSASFSSPLQLLTPSPASPSPIQPLTGVEEADLAETSGGYDDDFEVESRTSSRSSRRCLTPHHAFATSPSRPSSGASVSALERLRSPSRPEGPAPSRRSYRELR